MNGEALVLGLGFALLSIGVRWAYNEGRILQVIRLHFNAFRGQSGIPFDSKTMGMLAGFIGILCLLAVFLNYLVSSAP